MRIASVAFACVAGSVALFWSDAAEACSCRRDPGVEAAFESADAVFFGRLAASTEDDYDAHETFFYFDVIEVFKGPLEPGQRIRIVDPRRESSCAYHYG